MVSMRSARNHQTRDACHFTADPDTTWYAHEAPLRKQSLKCCATIHSATYTKNTAIALASLACGVQNGLVWRIFACTAKHVRGPRVASRGKSAVGRPCRRMNRALPCCRRCRMNDWQDWSPGALLLCLRTHAMERVAWRRQQCKHAALCGRSVAQHTCLCGHNAGAQCKVVRRGVVWPECGHNTHICVQCSA
eukprot:358378-Chlamydomonas_euryale.AAC.3